MASSVSKTCCVHTSTYPVPVCFVCMSAEDLSYLPLGLEGFMLLGHYAGIQRTGKGYFPFSGGTASPVVFSTSPYTGELH